MEQCIGIAPLHSIPLVISCYISGELHVPLAENFQKSLEITELLNCRKKLFDDRNSVVTFRLQDIGGKELGTAKTPQLAPLPQVFVL